MLDRAIERLTELRAKAAKRPEFFEMTYTIDRGLAYDIQMGCVVRKNPEVTTVAVREILDPLTNRSI
jgi:hypothetical protein